MKIFSSFLVVVVLLMLASLAANAQNNTRGDVNGDSEVNIADVNVVIDVILGGGSNTAADVNNDAEINIADINAVIDNIMGGSAPTPDHEYVDLGLPSGTLWATCNIGANSPEQSGNYFAWGETEPKVYYGSDNYKWYENDRITKYCDYSTYGYNGLVDNKLVLDIEDDAAYVNWGPSWRMPTFEQLQELIDFCTWTWINWNNVNGVLLYGPNGNTMFMPATGVIWESTFYPNPSYWSCMNGSGAEAFHAYDLLLYSDHMQLSTLNRFVGTPVRAVRVSQN